MIIKNKQTRKEYPCSKAQWAAFKQSVKDLFDVVDDNELKVPETQPIKNQVVVEPKNNGKGKLKTPTTGNKTEQK